MNSAQDGVESMTSIEERNGACPRCDGFMVPMVPDGSEEILLNRCELSGWRCVNCGERIDPRIVANRNASLRCMAMDGSVRLPS